MTLRSIRNLPEVISTSAPITPQSSGEIASYLIFKILYTHLQILHHVTLQIVKWVIEPYDTLMHTHTHTHTHTRRYTHMHTYIYTHSPADLSSCHSINCQMFRLWISEHFCIFTCKNCLNTDSSRGLAFSFFLRKIKKFI